MEIEMPNQVKLVNFSMQEFILNKKKEIKQSRYDRIPQLNRDQTKQAMLSSFAAVYKNIACKNLWRSEIVGEINSFVQENVIEHYKTVLLQKELQEYNLIHKLLRVHNDGTQNWYIIKLNKDKQNEFLQQIKQGKVAYQNIGDYGEIIYQGEGSKIPDQVQQRIDKEYYMGMRNKAIQINNLAYKNTREQNYKLSIQLYTKSLELDKLNCTTYNNRAFCYIMDKQYELAKKDLNMCLQLNPKYENAYKHFASIYFEQQDFSQSLKYVNKALKLNGDYTEATALQTKLLRFLCLKRKFERVFEDDNDRYVCDKKGKKNCQNF